MRPRIVAPPLLAAAVALAAAGCGSKSAGNAGTETKPSTAAKVGAPGAKVSFVKPTDGATTPGTVTANVKVTGFKLSPGTVGKAAKQGQGHLHFAMDEGKYDQPKYSGKNGQLAVKLSVQGEFTVKK